MAGTGSGLITVATQLDPNLHRRLEERCQVTDRSKAAEVRQAIRAWLVDGDDAQGEQLSLGASAGEASS